MGLSEGDLRVTGLFRKAGRTPRQGRLKPVSVPPEPSGFPSRSKKGEVRIGD
jgi:hypothetical protein